MSAGTRRHRLGPRALEIATVDALGLDNSLARTKVLIGAAGAAAKLLEAERDEGWGWDGDEA